MKGLITTPLPSGGTKGGGHMGHDPSLGVRGHHRPPRGSMGLAGHHGPVRGTTGLAKQGHHGPVGGTIGLSGAVPVSTSGFPGTRGTTVLPGAPEA